MKKLKDFNYQLTKNSLIILLVLGALVYGAFNRQKIVLPDKPAKPAINLVLPYIVTEDDQYVTFFGKSTPGSIIRLYLNNSSVENYTVADSEGDWHLVVAKSFKPGEYSAWATSTVDGSVSDFSNRYFFQVLSSGTYNLNGRVNSTLQ